MSISVQPEWCKSLPMQQQSVLLLAARGPDGITKSHPCKDVQRAYRATVLCAAKYGRELNLYSPGDTFMSFELFRSFVTWKHTVERFYREVDSLPHHFILHLLHATEILGYKHPNLKFRIRWRYFYYEGVKTLHLYPESEKEMDSRLSDWDKEFWD